MKFEEALTAMRSGKAITHPYLEKDVYYIGAYVIPGCYAIPGKFPVSEMPPMSICMMKGTYAHPDPSINLEMLMSDEWESFSLATWEGFY